MAAADDEGMDAVFAAAFHDPRVARFDVTERAEYANCVVEVTLVASGRQRVTAPVLQTVSHMFSFGDARALGVWEAGASQRNGLWRQMLVVLSRGRPQASAVVCGICALFWFQEVAAHGLVQVVQRHTGTDAGRSAPGKEPASNRGVLLPAAAAYKTVRTAWPSADLVDVAGLEMFAELVAAQVASVVAVVSPMRSLDDRWMWVGPLERPLKFALFGGLPRSTRDRILGDQIAAVTR